MTDKQIIIDSVNVSGCDFYDKNKKYCLTLKMNPTGFKNPSCFSGDFQKCIQDSKVCPYTFCDNNPNCYYKQLKRKEQECEELDKELHKNFEEKDILHLIIDRLLEASGYDTNTASAEEFEDVYEKMRYEKRQLDQLKAENDTYKKMLEDEEVILALTEVRTGERHLWYSNAQKLEKALTEIKEIAKHFTEKGLEPQSVEHQLKLRGKKELAKIILQKCEVLDE